MSRIKTVSDGKVNRTSPSALQKADHESGGCLAQWWYRYVAGLTEPQSPAAALGEKVHSEIENYLKTGEPALGAIAMSAWHFIPSLPRPLGVEHKVKLSDGFKVAGIPVLQKIDVIDPSGEYIDPMGAVQRDAPGTVEVIDWKTTSNIRYAKNGVQLLDTIQMSMYGRYIFEFTDADAVRLSHVYMQTKGRAQSKKSTILARREDIEKRWPRIESVARSIKDVAAEPDIRKVPKNLNACPRFGGCAYSDRCPKTVQQTMSQVFGGALAMSLLPPKAEAAATNPAMQALLAREAEVKAAKAEPPPRFVAAVNFIEESGLGFPGLSHEAAELFAQVKGKEWKKDTGYAGQGRAGGVTITTADALVSLAHEIGAELGTTFLEPAAPLPANAPVSDPVLAAEPVEGVPMPAAMPPAPTPAPTAAVVPDGGSVTVDLKMEDLKTEEKTDSAEVVEVLSPEEVKKISRKPDRMAEYERLYGEFMRLRAGGSPPPAAEAPSPTLTGPISGIYVNCIMPGAEPLEPYVAALCERMCKEFGVDDLRCASNDGPLGYGRWKGALAAFARTNPPTPGTYTLSTYGSEFAEIVAEALADKVVARGYGR